MVAGLVVVSVDVVFAVVDVVGLVLDVLVLVLVLVVVVLVVVLELLVVVGGVLVETVDVVELDEPLSSAATTASATPSPITAATSNTISALAPPLIPERGGGTSMRLVGSSCIGRQSRSRPGARSRAASGCSADRSGEQRHGAVDVALVD